MRAATAAVVAAVTAVGLALLAAQTGPSGAATTTTLASGSGPAVGVTRSTVTVTGVVGSEAPSVGADLGARARFDRANARGGVARRTVVYVAPPVGGPNELARAAFAVVPAVSDGLDTAGLAQARVPFVGAAS